MIVNFSYRLVTALDEEVNQLGIEELSISTDIVYREFVKEVEKPPPRQLPQANQSGRASASGYAAPR